MENKLFRMAFVRNENRFLIGIAIQYQNSDEKWLTETYYYFTNNESSKDILLAFSSEMDRLLESGYSHDFSVVINKNEIILE